MYGMIYIYEFEGDMGPKIPLVQDEDYIGFWREGTYSFLFFGKPKGQLFDSLSLPYRSELAINHEDWESGRPLDTMKAGRFVVHPPWKTPPPGEGLPICIDPNMAFGSGYHATTTGCLVLLDRLFAGWVPETVLDLGTGTGILSIACLKIGVTRAIGVDSNNLAVDVAKRNRELNHVPDRMELVMGDALDFVHLPADLLLANMHFAVLDQLVQREEFYTREYCLLSGMIRTEGAAIRERVERRLELIDSYSEDFWITHLYRKRQTF